MTSHAFCGKGRKVIWTGKGELIGKGMVREKIKLYGGWKLDTVSHESGLHLGEKEVYKM